MRLPTAAGLLACLALAAPLSAAAVGAPVLLGSTPADDAVVDLAQATTLYARFDRPIQLTASSTRIDLVDLASGDRRDLRSLALISNGTDHGTLVIKLLPSLAAAVLDGGSYAIDLTLGAVQGLDAANHTADLLSTTALAWNFSVAGSTGIATPRPESLSQPLQIAPGEDKTLAIGDLAGGDPGSGSNGAIRILTLPGLGELRHDGAPLVAGSLLSIDGLASRLLVYAPPKADSLQAFAFRYETSNGQSPTLWFLFEVDTSTSATAPQIRPPTPNDPVPYGELLATSHTHLLSDYPLVPVITATTTVSDGDGDIDGGSLLITYLDATRDLATFDQLYLLEGGVPVVAGGTISDGGGVIGTLDSSSDGLDGRSLRVTIPSTISVARAETLLQRLRYRFASAGLPLGNHDRSLRVTLSETAEGESSQVYTVRIAGTDSAPLPPLVDAGNGVWLQTDVNDIAPHSPTIRWPAPVRGGMSGILRLVDPEGEQLALRLDVGAGKDLARGLFAVQDVQHRIDGTSGAGLTDIAFSFHPVDPAEPPAALSLDDDVHLTASDPVASPAAVSHFILGFTLTPDAGGWAGSALHLPLDDPPWALRPESGSYVVRRRLSDLPAAPIDQLLVEGPTADWIAQGAPPAGLQVRVRDEGTGTSMLHLSWPAASTPPGVPLAFSVILSAYGGSAHVPVTVLPLPAIPKIAN